MFLTVTRRVCGGSLLRLECPLDQLLDVYDIWMGVPEDQMCQTDGGSTTVCKATKETDPDNVLDVGDLCQNKTQCEFSFVTGDSAKGIKPDGTIKTSCYLHVLSVTYRCVSKYCIEINKSLQFLAVLADSANTDKVVYGTIPNINTKTLTCVANIFGLAGQIGVLYIYCICVNKSGVHLIEH